MRTFRDSILAIAKASWLTDPDVGAPLLYSIGAVIDAIGDQAYYGVLASLAQYAPEDALALKGSDKQIVRGFAEDVDAYRVRVRTALDAWRHAAQSFGLLTQLIGYLSPFPVNVSIVSQHSVWDWVTGGAFLPGPYPIATLYTSPANWNWDGAPTGFNWSRFWLVINPQGAFTDEGTWGDGASWADDGSTWGTSATIGQVQAIQAIARQWRPLRTKLVKIIVSFHPSTEFLPGAPPADASLPNGQWGTDMKYAAGAAVPSRFTDCAYWDGVT